jgi:hypothetical protein
MAGAPVLLGCCGLAVSSDEGSRVRFSILTGSALGLAFLTKEYAFTLLPLPWLALALTSASPKRRLIYLGCIANASILICGGWLVRNEVLYGQAWPFRAELANIRRLLPDTVWNGPAPSWYFSEIFPKEFFQSFWYSGGWGQIRLPLGLYGLLGVVAAVLAVGFVCAMVRWGGTWQHRKAVVIVAAAILFDVAGAVYSNLAIHQPQGRYLLPAMPAVAVVLVVGLAGLLPSRAMRMGAVVVPTSLLVLSVYTLAFVVRPAYFG